MTNGSARLDGAYSERRTDPRYMFIATAEIIEPASDTHISGRVSEISRKGCYVDLLNTLPKDTPIRVQITTDHGKFECAGFVIYVQDRMGMGVAFVNPPNDQQAILDGWLADLAGR